VGNKGEEGVEEEDKDGEKKTWIKMKEKKNTSQ
jgi:hypothetical protein